LKGASSSRASRGLEGGLKPSALKGASRELEGGFFFELMPCALEALTVIKTFCL